MLYSAASAAILSSLGNGQKNLEGTAEQGAARNEGRAVRVGDSEVLLGGPHA